MASKPYLLACANRCVTAQIYGIDREWTTISPEGHAGQTYPAGTPLPLREAALAVGMRHATAKRLSLTPEWIEALKAEQDDKSFAEDPENIHKLILTRDRDDHDGAERLKAIETIRGKPPEHSITWDEFAVIRKQAKALAVEPGVIIKDPGVLTRPAVDPSLPVFKGRCTQARQRPRPQPEPAWAPRLGGRKVR